MYNPMVNDDTIAPIDYDMEDSILDEIVKRNLMKDIDNTTISNNKNNTSAVGDNLKVFLKLKPLGKEDIERDSREAYLEIENTESLLVHPLKEANANISNIAASSRNRNAAQRLNNNDHRFLFTHIFSEKSTQEEFFDGAVLPLVKDFIDSQNCLIFAYGVTNSGKTHTMQGTQSQPGVMPRALDVIFNSIGDHQYKNTQKIKPCYSYDCTILSAEEEAKEIILKEAILKPLEVKEIAQMLQTSSSLKSLNKNFDNSESMQGKTTKNNDENISSSADCLMFKADSLEDISSVIASRCREQATLDIRHHGSNVRFSVWVSFVEIYNEQIYDLLVPISNGTIGANKNVQNRGRRGEIKRKPLQLKEDNQGRPYIKDATEINVNSADEAFKLLALGKRNQKIAFTCLNESSSRSHCIFNIKLMRMQDSDNPKYVRISSMILCDLAGLERSSKAMTGGERMKEANNINTSIMVLGRCIEIIRQNQNLPPTKQKIPPFRDSKLTRLFQNNLTGKGRAAIIVTVGQTPNLYQENLNAIKFSAIAKQIVIPKMAVSVIPPLDEPPAPKVVDIELRRDTVQWASPGAMLQCVKEGLVDMSSAVLQAGASYQEALISSDSENENSDVEGELSQEFFVESNFKKIVEAFKDLYKENKLLRSIVESLKMDALKFYNEKCEIEAKVRKEGQKLLIEQHQKLTEQYESILEEREESSVNLQNQKLDLLNDHYQRLIKRQNEYV